MSFIERVRKLVLKRIKSSPKTSWYLSRFFSQLSSYIFLSKTYNFLKVNLYSSFSFIPQSSKVLEKFWKNDPREELEDSSFYNLINEEKFHRYSSSSRIYSYFDELITKTRSLVVSKPFLRQTSFIISRAVSLIVAFDILIFTCSIKEGT